MVLIRLKCIITTLIFYNKVVFELLEEVRGKDEAVVFALFSICGQPEVSVH